MKILFTGFTSRTIGSDRNVYDYMSNVFVLERALRLAGHEVDVRPVSIANDPCVDQDYDAAVVGIAAMQGLSSRFKLGALWTLHKFGPRAGIFPSDGKNLYTFPGSVLTCLSGTHVDKETGQKIDPIDYMLGALQREKNNVDEHELGGRDELKAIWRSVLEQLPHSDTKPYCFWKMLIPTHSWGHPTVYAKHFGADVTSWDPTHVAIPMQFTLANGASELCPESGRLPMAETTEPAERERAWVVSSLQDQTPWIKKQACKWPVVVVGNKRLASKGAAVEYVPERELIDTYYRRYWGHLAFGYPLAEGGWWRMRYVHAALAGIVTCCDEADARRMPDAYRYSRIMLERWSNDKLVEVALDQHRQLMAASRSVDEAVAAVDGFVRKLVA